MVSKILKLVFVIYNTKMTSKSKVWQRELITGIKGEAS